MKTSILTKIAAALAIGAAFPLGAIAAQPTKTTTEQGVIQKVKAEKVKSPKKHNFATPWMESSSGGQLRMDRPNESFGNSNRLTASELKTREARQRELRLAMASSGSRSGSRFSSATKGSGLTRPQGTLYTAANWPCGSGSSRRRLPDQRYEENQVLVVDDDWFCSM